MGMFGSAKRVPMDLSSLTLAGTQPGSRNALSMSLPFLQGATVPLPVARPQLPYDLDQITGGPNPLPYDLAALRPLPTPQIVCPVRSPAHLNSPFGPRPQTNEFHNGIDLRNRLNDPVYAIKDGTVEVFSNKKGGNSIALYGQDASRAGYAHTRATVPTGTVVRAGQKIGESDTSGHQEAPHLHFTYTPPHTKAKIDPLEILRNVCGRGNF